MGIEPKTSKFLHVFVHHSKCLQKGIVYFKVKLINVKSFTGLGSGHDL